MPSEIQDQTGKVLVTFDRLPTFPLRRRILSNVAVGLSVGNKARASKRGDPRLAIEMTFEQMNATQAGDFLRFLRDFAAGAKPFVLAIVQPLAPLADGSAKADGSKMAGGQFTVRYYGEAPNIDEAFFLRHRFD